MEVEIIQAGSETKTLRYKLWLFRTYSWKYIYYRESENET